MIKKTDKELLYKRAFNLLFVKYVKPNDTRGTSSLLTFLLLFKGLVFQRVLNESTKVNFLDLVMTLSITSQIEKEEKKKKKMVLLCH